MRYSRRDMQEWRLSHFILRLSGACGTMHINVIKDHEGHSPV
tara:strand:+ start:72 stop:197 length:126 start_codon:yes stop_codon:yes gene_type:complete